jgi:hypothetical protein
MSVREEPGRPGLRQTFVRTPLGIALSLLAAAVGAYLLAYHTTHVLQALPYLFLLACPLMHVFMHRGHGHKHGADT